jgi:uncharacterized protein (TIGR02118 family)
MPYTRRGDKVFHVVFLCKKRDDMTQEEFTNYWLKEHTPLTARVPGVRAYRCYPLVGYDGEYPGYDAVAFLTFDDEAAWRSAENSPEFKAALEDAKVFQNTQKTFAFYATEHVIV